MIPAIVILLYVTLIAFVGSIAFRRGKTNTEDFFLANRSVGEMVFFLSLFATNMTAFAILGSSGMSYKQGHLRFWAVRGCRTSKESACMV